VAIRRWGTARGEATAVFDRYGMRASQLSWFSMLSSSLVFACAYTWLLSLQHTTVAANNSIYQVCVCVCVCVCICVCVCVSGSYICAPRCSVVVLFVGM
ncbi:MAG: hypothetical protein P4L40_14355, partial [Terracidiphilus sp.]|nr:hypothetical protein [Terracidiphilus sp.]